MRSIANTDSGLRAAAAARASRSSIRTAKETRDSNRTRRLRADYQPSGWIRVTRPPGNWRVASVGEVKTILNSPSLPAVRLLTLLLSEEDREKHDAEYDDKQGMKPTVEARLCSLPHRLRQYVPVDSLQRYGQAVDSLTCS